MCVCGEGERKKASARNHTVSIHWTNWMNVNVPDEKSH